MASEVAEPPHPYVVMFLVVVFTISCFLSLFAPRLWRKGFSKEFTEGVLRPMLTPLFVTARGNMIQSAGATREYFKLSGGMPFLSLDLELGDQTLAALAAAGDELKRALGENLDMYEGAATSRIR